MKKILFALFALSLFSCSSGDKKEIRYSGDDISSDFSVTRDKLSKKASLEVEEDGKWIVYAGNSVETIDLNKPILTGDRAGTYSLSVPDSVRSYFLVETAKGTAILSERHLPMTGGYNYRDLGGIRNKDGRYVKWGKVFRADELYQLNDADLNYLNQIPIRSVVDFRSAEEIKNAPDRVPASALWYGLSISPGSLTANSMEDVMRMSPDATVELMKEMNRLFSTDSTIVAQYRTFFQMLQDETKTPLLFHCTAGKDRTGMGAALFLYSLDVDEDTIIKDYLSSNTYLEAKYGEQTASYPQLKPLLEVEEDFIRAGIDQIKRDHGTVENYLEQVLHVDLNKMREQYLEH